MSFRRFGGSRVRRIHGDGSIALNPLTIDAGRLIGWWSADFDLIPMGLLRASGTSPPALNMQGQSASARPPSFRISSLGTGALGSTKIEYSCDNFATIVETGVTTAASVTLNGEASGYVLNCPSGPYSANNLWVPSCALFSDQSELGGDLEATSTSFCPQIEATGWNGLPSLIFDGSSSLLFADNSQLPQRIIGGNDTEFHIYLALQLIAATAAKTVLNLYNSTTGKFYSFAIEAGPVYSFNKNDNIGGNITVTGGVPDTSRHILRLSNSGTVQSMALDSNDNLVALSSGGAMDVATFGTGMDRIGFGFQRTATSTRFCNMRVREMAIFGPGHSAAAQAKMFSYMLQSSPL